MSDSITAQKKEEKKYWKTFERTATQTHYGAVKCLIFSSRTPHDIYAAHSERVTVHSAQNFSSQRILCDLAETVRTIRCRNDGELLLLGGDDHNMRLISSSALFPTNRVYKGHIGSVHVVDFHPSQSNTLLSSGDDKNLIQWDLMSSRVVRQQKVSEEFVRAGTWHGSSLYATGSHDKLVRFWDLRNHTKTPAYKFEVGDCVESLYSIPNTDLLVSAAGDTLVVFSTRKNKILKTISDHEKTFSVLTGSIEGRRIFSGGADGSINIYETQNFELTHRLNLKKPISTFAVSPNGEDFAVGYTTGKMKLYSRKGKEEYKIEEEESALGKYLCAVNERKRTRKRGLPMWFEKDLCGNGPEVNKLFLKPKPGKRRRIRCHDVELEKLNFSGALKLALKSEKPWNLVYLFEKLWQREMVESTIKGLETACVEQLIKFVIEYIKDPKKTPLAIHIGELLLKMYGNDICLRQGAHNMFEELRVAVDNEIKLLGDLTLILGSTSLLGGLSKESEKRKNNFVSLWQ